MKKILIIIIIMVMAANLYSCVNITFADFTPNDIGNIMNFLFFRDDCDNGYDNNFSEEPESPEEPNGQSEQSEQNEQSGIEYNGAVAGIHELPAVAETAVWEPGTLEVPDTAEPEPPVEFTEPAENTETTETPEQTPPPNIHRQVRTDSLFADAPRAFRDVMFPENLRMTGTVQQTIRTLEPFSFRDFGGATFHLMTTNPVLFTPELGGGYLSDMRNYRTRLVEAACNIELGVIAAEAGNLAAMIEREINAGNFVADVLAAPLEVQSRLAERGLLLNLRRIPFINLGAEHYNRSAIEAATINGNMYSVVSDAVFDPNTIYAMFYNRDLIRRYNLQSPAVLRANNEWTYTAMFALSRELSAASVDVNGNYFLGFNNQNSDIINGLFTGAGNTFFDTRPNDYPVLNFNNRDTRRFIDSLIDIFSRPDLNFFDPDAQIQREAFMRSNVLFSVSTLDIIPAITDIEFDWGILPVPTLDGGGAIGFVSRDSLALSVLRDTPNTELSGFVTEALSVASHGILREAYIHEQLMYTLRDVHSVRALNDIINNVTYSQYNMYSTIDRISEATVGVINEAANRRGVFDDLYETAKNRLEEFFRTAQIFMRN